MIELLAMFFNNSLCVNPVASYGSALRKSSYSTCKEYLQLCGKSSKEHREEFCLSRVSATKLIFKPLPTLLQSIKSSNVNVAFILSPLPSLLPGLEARFRK